MRFWRVAVWLLAIGLGVWTLAQLPLAEIDKTLNGLNALDGLVWCALNALIIALGTHRWWWLVAALGAHIAWFRLLAVRQAGQAVSFVTPGPQFGGEPLQVYWLSQSTGTNRSLPVNTAVVSLALDRVYELLTNFSVLVLGLVWLMFSPLMAVANWPVLTVVLCLLLLATIGLVVWLARFKGSKSRFLSRLNNARGFRFTHHLRNAQATVAQLLSVGKAQLLVVLGVSLLVWLILLFELRLLLHFVGVEPDLHGFVLLVVAQRMAMLLPVPGGLGSVEAAVFWVFQILGWPAGGALGLIALIRLRDAVILLFGLALMYRLQALGRRSNNPA